MTTTLRALERTKVKPIADHPLAPPSDVILRVVPGFNDRYSAGSDGHVYCYSDGRNAAKKPRPFRLCGTVGSNGYLFVAAWDGRRKVTRAVHTMVCSAFHGPKPSPTLLVRHLDGDPTNNKPGNLCWGSYAENEADKRRHGRVACGSRQGIAKLNEEAVRILRIAIPSGLWNPIDAAKVFGVDPSVIRAAVSGKSWRHVENGDQLCA